VQMGDRDNMAQRVLSVSAARVLRYAAFTYLGRGGNSAGVLLDAADLDDSVRLAVAAQVGYSETAFVEAQGGHGQYRMRFFSALAEVAFCGHATIAAAVAIADRDGPGLIQFSTLSGLVTVQIRVTAEGTTATLTSVPTRTRPAQAAELDWALAALRWHHSDLDPRYPAHVAYGGNEHLVLAVRERSLLAGVGLRLLVPWDPDGSTGMDDGAARVGRGSDGLPRPRPLPTRRRHRGPRYRCRCRRVRRIPT